MIRLFSSGELPLMDIIELQGRIVLPEDAAARGHDTASTHGTESSNTEADDGVPVLPLGDIKQDHLNAKRCTLRIGTLHVDGSRGVYKMPLLVMKRCDEARVAELVAMRYGGRDAATVLADHGDQPAPSKKVQRREDQQRSSVDPAVAAVDEAGEDEEESTMLLSEWLEKHPESLSIDSLYFPPPAPASLNTAGPSASTPKDLGTAEEKAVEQTATEGSLRPRAAAERRTETTNTSASASHTHLAGLDMKDYELVGLITDHVCFNSKPARVFA